MRNSPMRAPIMGAVLALLVLAHSGPGVASKPGVNFGELFNFKNTAAEAAAASVKPRSSAQEQPQDGANVESSSTASPALDTTQPLACGYDACPRTDPNKVNVHIVAHTHDDVGWLKTVDQYYYGTMKKYSSVGVQYILDSVVPQLIMDPSKRFIYVEMSFFSKWWLEQDDNMKAAVRKLVNEGRLEFINGGWCMNDEATVTYQSSIEQMTLGLKFLEDEFGACGRPKVGWQIDPFGHTNEQASLFAQFGFDGMYFTRIDYDDKAHRTHNKSLDIIWHGDRALPGQSGSIFTNIFRDGYDAPNGFCFDAMCLDPALVDNPKSYEYNMQAKGQQYIHYLKEYARSKLYNHVLIPMGGDFQYSAAGQNFKNLDKLIAYVNTHAGNYFNVFYSTPSCYQYSVYQSMSAALDSSASTRDAAPTRLPEKYDDFMPYASSPTVWWSGYFTSRPSVKLIERETANLLYNARLASLIYLTNNDNAQWTDGVREHERACLQQLWEVLGDLQHHDAVTGTEKQHVADDYVRRASDIMATCAGFIGNMQKSMLDNSVNNKSSQYEKLRDSARKYKQLEPMYLDHTSLCNALNISQCDVIEAEINPKTYQLNPAARHTTTTHAQQQQRPASQPTQNQASRSRRSPSDARHVADLSHSSHKPPQQSVPDELTTRAVLMHVYNPLARPLAQHDIRLPCNGRCDLDRVKVVHLASREELPALRLPNPAGVSTLPFRDSQTNYELLFYADLPALGYSSFLIEDTNTDDIVEEDAERADSIVINDDAKHKQSVFKHRRIKRQDSQRFEYFTMRDFQSTVPAHTVSKRDTNNDASSSADRVIIKFDMHTGMIVGLKRASDGSVLNITQKFGVYYAAEHGSPAGAYIFRPNSSEPHMVDKPEVFRMYKRKNGSLIEIHQKWNDWIWQTIRVDGKKNYIEFDYVVGPLPDQRLGSRGIEVVTRYMTNLQHNGVFLTDSNSRQLLVRHRRAQVKPAEDLGGSFYPVVSTMMLKSVEPSQLRSGHKSAEAVAVLTDRSQAGTSLNEGQLELLLHRRHSVDDNFGVAEPLDEPGEDNRGLVTRGKHRLYLKFAEPAAQVQQQQQQQQQDHHENHKHSRHTQRSATQQVSERQLTPYEPMHKKPTQLFRLQETPRANTSYEQLANKAAEIMPSTYIVSDPLYSDLRVESSKLSMPPLLTFDRLRSTLADFLAILSADAATKSRVELSMLNESLPSNIHLLTLQPWNRGPNELLIRLENLDNPLTLHPLPSFQAYSSLLRSYGHNSQVHELIADSATCTDNARPKTNVSLEHLFKRLKIVDLEEMTLGANARLQDTKRLDWTGESNDMSSIDCNNVATPSAVSLTPRQIRTFIARFEYV